MKCLRMFAVLVAIAIVALAAGGESTMAYTRETYSLLIDWNKDGTGTEYVAYWDGDGNGVSISNGLSADDGGFYSASMSLRLRNTNGEFNRNNPNAGTYGYMTERVPIELKITHSAVQTTRFKGFVQSISGPDYGPAGVNSASFVDLHCVGILAAIAEDEVSVTATASVDIDAALTTVCANLGLAAGDYAFADSDQVIPLYFEQRRKVQDVFRDLAATEMGGALYEGTKTGKITNAPRDLWLHGAVDATWGDDNAASDKVFPDRIRPIVRNELTTAVDVEVKRYVLGDDGTVVYNAYLGPDLYGTPGVYASWLIPANGRLGPTYIAPNQQGAAGLSGLPVSTANIDYTANSAADGSGSDQTSSVAVSFTDPLGASIYYYTITNTSGSDIYLTKFIIRSASITDGSGSGPAVVSDDSMTGSTLVSGSNSPWANATNITSSNNSYATSTFDGVDIITDYLIGTPDGIAIPLDATIHGVLVEVEAKVSAGGAGSMVATLWDGSTVWSYSYEATPSTTEQYLVFGGPDDLWGRSLTAQNFNSATSTFGIAIQQIASGLGAGDVVSVDHMRFTIYYTVFGTAGISQQTATAELAIPNTKGGRRKQVTLPWSNDLVGARDYAQHLLRIGRYPEELLELTFQWKDDSVIDAMLATEIGQLIAYQDTSVGTSRGSYNDDYYRILGIQQNNVVGAVPESKITLRPSLNYRNLDAIVWDDFNRNNSTLGGSAAPTGDSWNAASGTWAVSSLKAAPTGGSTDIITLGVGSANHVVEAGLEALTDTSAVTGLVFRYSSTSNYWRFVLSRSGGSDTWALIKRVAAVETTVASGAWTATTTAELRIACRTNDIRCWLDRRLVAGGPNTLISDSALVANTSAGLFATTTTTSRAVAFYAEGL